MNRMKTIMYMYAYFNNCSFVHAHFISTTHFNISFCFLDIVEHTENGFQTL